MRLTQQLLVFRLGAFTLTVAALAGCASMPSPEASNPATSYGSALAKSAYSTGQTCYAPSPDLKAAYNQPYEIDGQWYHPMRNDAGFSETGIASWYDRQSEHFHDINKGKLRDEQTLNNRWKTNLPIL